MKNKRRPLSYFQTNLDGIARDTIKVLPLCIALMLCNPAISKEKLPYRDASLPVEVRLADLIQRMTIEEKVGQLCCTLGWDYYINEGGEITLSPSFKEDIAQRHIGMIWGTFRADPWTKKSLSNGLTPKKAAILGNAMQRWNLEHTRLGIPLFLCEEAPHGHMAIGATVFPTGIGLASTWDPALLERVGRVISKEIRLQGGHVSYGPVMDLSLDPRWSRVEETMGEDPVLCGVLGAAMVRGLGGGNINRPYSTLATLKHFIGYGSTEGGQNGAPTHVGPRELLGKMLPPFHAAIDAGAWSVMTSYNSLDGVPCTSNRWLLTSLLRDEWGFKGIVVSDLYSINGLKDTHCVVSSLSEAGGLALTSGVDIDLGGLCYSRLMEALAAGEVSESSIDQAVERVLRLKFEMGLFDNPYVDENIATDVGNSSNREISLEAARSSITLLKNEGILPLSKNLHVAVIGPNAHNRYNMLGDYTSPQPESSVTTLLEGVSSKIGADHVEYALGCSIRDTSSCDIPTAMSAARRSDVVIVAVGGSSARDFRTNYQNTGAAEATRQEISDMECGEGYDRATLTLMGHQQELLDSLKSTGKPLVVVYIEGRPLDKRWASSNADALLTAWYPGQEGGTAIADILFGDYNPAGRLPISIPRDVGQLPVYYNRLPPTPHDYVDEQCSPLYAFGYGLSYTTFEYSSLEIIDREDSITVSCTVRNSGNRTGDEVVQLYVHDVVSSIVQPMKQLKKFIRISLSPGETRHVDFTLHTEDLSIIGPDMRRMVEPGTFKIMIGSSSDDIRLSGSVYHAGLTTLQ